jgi:membrane protease YdiL (CAAX protease family)
VGRLVDDPRSLGARRLWLLLGYWAFGLLMRLPVAAINRHLPPGRPRELLLFALKAALSVLLPLLLLRAFEPAASVRVRLGLTPLPGPRKRVAAGMLALGWLAFAYVGATLQDGHAPSLAPASATSALGMAAGVFIEEIAFRGFILGGLAADRPFWRANLVTSLMFLSMHLPGWYASGLRVEMVPMSLLLLALSLLLGWTTRWTGTIWLASALHLANNAISGW